MKKFIVTLVHGNSIIGNVQQKFENEEEAKTYAAKLAIMPSFIGVEIGVYELKTTTIYEPSVTFKDV
jgi:ribosomal protein S19